MRFMTWFLGLTRACLLVVALCGIFGVCSSAAISKPLSDAEIDRLVKEPANRKIIEEFLKYELGEVNNYAVRPLLQQHPSLIFFINQAERGPVKNLLFLEDQVNKLREAQKDINAFPYSVVFSSDEKKIILSLKASADEIVLKGIPLFKRDLYRVLVAAKELADQKGKTPIELMPDSSYRNGIFRRCEPVPKRLDEDMGELSQGELLCFRLGWELEKVTLTRLWLVLNDNQLPRPDDYVAYRTKRSEYWQKRMAGIYAARGENESSSGKKAQR
jgi:hypothetical protein